MTSSQPERLESEVPEAPNEGAATNPEGFDAYGNGFRDGGCLGLAGGGIAGGIVGAVAAVVIISTGDRNSSPDEYNQGVIASEEPGDGDIDMSGEDATKVNEAIADMRELLVTVSDHGGSVDFTVDVTNLANFESKATNMITGDMSMAVLNIVFDSKKGGEYPLSYGVLGDRLAIVARGDSQLKVIEAAGKKFRPELETKVAGLFNKALTPCLELLDQAKITKLVLTYEPGEQRFNLEGNGMECEFVAKIEDSSGDYTVKLDTKADVGADYRLVYTESGHKSGAQYDLQNDLRAKLEKGLAVVLQKLNGTLSSIIENADNGMRLPYSGTCIHESGDDSVSVYDASYGVGDIRIVWKLGSGQEVEVELGDVSTNRVSGLNEPKELDVLRQKIDTACP